MAKNVVTFQGSSAVSANPSSVPPCWHAHFLQMLPKIEQHASFAFRDLKGERRDEVIQEVSCNACAAFARLAEQNRTEAATWSSLAKYAVRQVRDGRQVGTSRNVQDISSQHCQQKKGVDMRSIHRWDDRNEEWTEMIVEDRRTTPADVAALRIDFREFFKSLSRRDRRVALKLAKGHATSWVARKFRISAGRVSQIRQELYEAWEKFQADRPVEAELAVA